MISAIQAEISEYQLVTNHNCQYQSQLPITTVNYEKSRRRDAGRGARMCRTWERSVLRQGSISALRQAHEQPSGNRYVQQIPAEAVKKGGSIRKRRVEDGTGHPATECHAGQGRRELAPDARSLFRCGIVFPNDQHVCQDDTALHQTEQRSYNVERGQPVRPEVKQKGCRLQRRAEQQRG